MQSEKRHQLLILTPDTAIDGASAGDMLEQTRLALDDGCRDVVVDLHAAPHIAAVGLKAMLDIAALLAESGGHLAVAGLHDQTQAIMQVSGLSHVLLQFDTVGDAEHSLGGMRAPGHASAAEAEPDDEDEEDYGEDEDEDDHIFEDE